MLSKYTKTTFAIGHRTRKGVLAGVLAHVPALFLTFGVLAACSSGQESEGTGSGGSSSSAGGKATGGSSSGAAVCGANPQPGDACTGNGTCSSSANCFCLTSSVSCADGPPPASGGRPSGGGGQPSGSAGQPSGNGNVDCGNNPGSGDNCNTFGLCDSDPDCLCDGNEVRTCSGNVADCGADPQRGDNCTGGPGICDGSQRCWCNSDGEVRCP